MQSITRGYAGRMARRFCHELRVRYAECDPQGVVFNAHYVAYFDVVMTELWREAGIDYLAMVRQGTDNVVAEVGVRYLGPAGFDDVLTLEATITRLGRTGMTTRIEVRRDGAPVVEGEVRHVFTDARTKASKAIPAEVRRGLEPYVEVAREPVA